MQLNLFQLCWSLRLLSDLISCISITQLQSKFKFMVKISCYVKCKLLFVNLIQELCEFIIKLLINGSHKFFSLIDLLSTD